MDSRCHLDGLTAEAMACAAGILIALVPGLPALKVSLSRMPCCGVLASVGGIGTISHRPT
jgi:hypothetical protein